MGRLPILLALIVLISLAADVGLVAAARRLVPDGLGRQIVLVSAGAVVGVVAGHVVARMTFRRRG